MNKYNFSLIDIGEVGCWVEEGNNSSFKGSMAIFFKNTQAEQGETILVCNDNYLKGAVFIVNE